MTAFQIALAASIGWVLCSVLAGFWLGAVIGLNDYDEDD